ncbi:MAG TPA: cyclic 2,3-diphosphoglycerate synthase [Aggregatilineaceae bacterium]|nr:cyclic 2,3-diphosphoglycerate synthase [Aggregatilineaceae bacterium]
MPKTRVVIMGAAGRDFHNFNLYYRRNEAYEVVAFTATQIPDIEGRTYPPELAGALYPGGIPIYEEAELSALIREHDIDEVVFAYSDVSHETVMHKASQVLAAGADFRLLGPKHTTLKSSKPVVGVGAVRTGSGKSQTTRTVSDALRRLGYTVAVVRHPMPYGDLARQKVQRFADYADLDRHDVTIEEREEYEPHLDRGVVVFAGVDYEAILREAEQEADIVLWDGGNNDLPFFQPDLYFVVVDPHRPGHERTYHPGEANLRMADVVVINKVDTAPPDGVRTVRESIRQLNPGATVIEAASPTFVDDAEAIRGKKVLVIEDGPTLTHGEMGYGAGVVAAQRFGAGELVDPRPYAVGSIADTFAKYPTTGTLLPAMGYGAKQRADLEQTIRNTPADLVLVATPIDLTRVISIDKPYRRVRYELQELGNPTIAELLEARFGRKG